ncbi:PilW family protein [Aquabacterium sp.]|uniref:PilW family protein n=1 Tax=Aquabacterium sp. TaxID=1872578 RepID=UPI0035B3A180
MKRQANRNARSGLLTRSSTQSGISLVEMLVSMVVGLVVVGAGLAMYVSSGFASKGSTALSQMTEDASIALSLLRSQVAMAGYSNPTGINSDGLLTKNYTGIAIFGCDGGPTAATANGGLASMVCNGGAAADSIVTLYEADTSNTVATSSGAPTDCLGSGLTASGGYYLAENRFFVSNNTLSCLGNGNTTSQPLVDNVVDMQITYGVADTTTVGSTTVTGGVAKRYMSATDIIDTASVAPTTAAKWGQVTSVRICIVVRSEDQILDSAASYYNCAGTATTPADKRLYRAFTTTVTLQNRI